MPQKPIKFNIPTEATKFILFQRTQYLLFRRSRVIQWGIKFLPSFVASPFETSFTKFNSIIFIESKLFKKRVSELFSEEIFAEYEAMKKHLPTNAHAILDIGCGIGGIDVLLNEHYKNTTPSIYLLDKTEMPKKVYYGLEERGCFYNSFEVVKDFLTKNGVKCKQIFTQEANKKNTIDFNATFDLIISLISWGFHYPVSTYLDQVYDKLSPGGVLIIDVRKSFGGTEALQKKFGNMEIIQDAIKHSRVIFRKVD